ncbi:helix-turn-helix transcriptional regulator [Anseongella ginsenosidimutans]|nr:LuxR C-terminal-related transcriptional regulator [Anseongella ginsenosidimutans]QEC51907.1 hypothetical protein FRZ59_05870 [Anseongella ginsenosidimutans]
MRKTIVVCFLIFLSASIAPATGQAQSVIVDSLKTIIDNAGTANGERIEAMERLSKIMAVQNQPEDAFDMLTRAQRLSHGEEDGRYGALVHSALSYLHVQRDSLKLAFPAIDSAEWYASRTGDKVVKGLVRFRRGWLEHIIENTDEAYQDMLEALRLLEGEDTFLYRSNIYHYLAAIQGYWGNTGKQLHYTRLCLDAALKSGDPDAMSNACLSMGASYLYRFRKEPSRRKLLDSASYYNQLVLKLTDSLKKRITLPSTEGIAALNMANLYLEFYPPSYKDSAEVYLKQALAVGREVDNSEIIANSYGILSEYALNESKYGRAEELLLQALDEISGNAGGALVKSRITKALARVAEKSGDAEGALDYYKQYMQHDKALFDEAKLSMTQRLEAQYQSEKQEFALATAEQEAAFSKKLNRYYLILIIAGGLALFFLFRSFRFKLKASRQRDSLRAEEAARLEAERELLQERLNQLEKELLAGTLHVEEKNRLLQHLREKLGSLDSSDPLHRQIDRLIAKNDEVDEGYDNMKTEFAEIRPEFTGGLQQRAENKLTRLDLKYCSYILMGLTNKEIASKLNVDPKSIRMARYRIKQKLKLQKDESLDRFINELASKQDMSA